MIKKLIASFLLTTFITNTAYAEKIMFDSYGRPIKSEKATQTNITPETFTIETADKTPSNPTVQTQISEQTQVQSSANSIHKPQSSQTEVKNMTNKLITSEQSIKNDYSNLNYKASTFNMDLSQAIKGYYGVDAENEPLIIRAYNLQRKNGVLKDKMNLEKAPKRPESYFIALKKGIIPKYFASTYYVCDNEVVMNLLVEAYDLMIKNNFSEKDIKNFMYFATFYFEDTQAINISDIESIINNKSIPKEDKIYYIYAKMEAIHQNNPNVETDIIKALKLLKQNPKVVKKGIYSTSLNDETLVILNFDTERCCKTEEIIKKVLDMKNLSDEEKFFRILGEIKKEILKKEKENYPEILYQIAEIGILSRYFNDNKYYKDEKVLQDVLSASKLLIKNKYWEWVQDENEDIFTIAPELCMTTKIVQEILNDKKIPMKDKEEIMARRLLKEKYLAYNENQIKSGYNYNLVTDEGFSLIEKGYFPKFCKYEYDLKKDKEAKNYNQVIDIYKNKGFSDTHIKTLIACDACDIDIAEKINSPNEILKEKLLLKEPNNEQWKQIITTYFDTGLINIDNTNSSQFRNLRIRECTAKDIENIAKLRYIEGVTKEDIQYFVDHMRYLFPYIAISSEKVIKDPTIKIEDRIIFITELAEREKVKANPKASDSYKKLIDEGINPIVLSVYEEYCDNKDILNLYNYMHNELGYNLKQCEKIISYIDKSNSEYNVKYEKVLKIVEDEKLNYEHKIKALENALKNAGIKADTKSSLKDIAGKALLVITAPIWIIPAAILMILLACSDNGTGSWN